MLADTSSVARSMREAAVSDPSSSTRTLKKAEAST
jgi:hypothetical protein